MEGREGGKEGGKVLCTLHPEIDRPHVRCKVRENCKRKTELELKQEMGIEPVGKHYIHVYIIIFIAHNTYMYTRLI